MSHTPVEKPILGGTVMPRRTAVTLVVMALVPPVAWISALAASYAIDDFVCAAADSAGVAGPSTGVLTAVLIVNGLLFAATVVAGVVAFRIGRARRKEHPVIGFLGLTTLPSAVIFGHGILFIAVMILVFGGCA